MQKYQYSNIYISNNQIEFKEPSILKFFRAELKTLRIGLLHTFFSGFGQTFFLSLFSGYIITEYSLSRTGYGGLYSIATLGSAFLLPIPGAWIDKFNLRQFSGVTGILITFACILFAWSPNLWVLGFSLFLLRFSGQGLMSHIASTTMSRHYGSNRGKALSIVNLGYPLSEALLPILAVLIIQYYLEWRIAPAAMSILGLLVFMPLSQIWITKDSEIDIPPLKKKSFHPLANQWTRSDVIKHPLIYFLIPIFTIPPFLITGFLIQQSAFDQFGQWDINDFSMAVFLFAIFRATGSIGSGPLLDNLGAKKLIYLYTLPILTGIGLTSLGLSPFYLFALAGITAGAGGSIKTSLLNEIFGSTHLGAIRSVVSSFMAISTGISPLLFGSLLDHGHSMQAVLNGSIAANLISIILLSIGLKGFIDKK